MTTFFEGWDTIYVYKTLINKIDIFRNPYPEWGGGGGYPKDDII